MNYKIEFEKAAIKFINKQNAKIQQKILSEINKLPMGNDVKKLKGLVNHYRLRVDDFRVIYTKNNDVYVVKVVNIDNRGDVYK